MITSESILNELRTVMDPEMPINIVDLGLVEGVRIDATDNSAAVSIDILPTFVGCPALAMIEDDIRDTVSRQDGVGAVDVQFLYDPPWSVDRISDAGRASLREHGVTVPERGSLCGASSDEDDSLKLVQLQTSAVPCPFCGSRQTRMDSPFGPTRCRMIYYCDGCRNSFEHMKRI